MSIATAITNLQGRVESAYDKIEEMGGTLPQVLNTANLPDAIDSIPSSGGTTKKWGMTLDEILYANDGVLHTFGAVSGDVNFNGISSIAEYGLYGTFRNSSIKSVSFPDLTTTSNYGMTSAFYDCANLLSVSFPGLTNIGYFVMSETFTGCTALTNISFPELSTITGNSGMFGAFNGCVSLTTASFPKLKEVSGNRTFGQAFVSTQVTTLSFPELSTMYNTGTLNSIACFYNNTTLTALYFPKLIGMSTTNTKTAVNATHLFDGCTNLAEIHFGAENQSIIEGSSGYATKWGAPNANCQIYFDL